MSRANRKEDWYIVKGEHCYAPPTWVYTEAQLQLMAFMAHKHMPANVTDRLLEGRRLECLSDGACRRLEDETKIEFARWGLLWYRAPWEAK